MSTSNSVYINYKHSTYRIKSTIFYWPKNDNIPVVFYTSRVYATMSVSVSLSICLWRKCIGAL